LRRPRLAEVLIDVFGGTEFTAPDVLDRRGTEKKTGAPAEDSNL